jgi:hypothetical protein
MHAKLNDWKNGWFGVELGIRRGEIDNFIALLQMIKADPDQHFHLSSDYKAEGLGDVEIYVQPEDVADNLTASGLAIAPEENRNGNGA